MKMLRYKKTKNGGDTDDNIQTSKVRPSSNQVSIPISAWKVLAILSCIATMVMYAETMLIPAIPDLIKDFAVSYSMSSWILTAYLVSGAVMTPIAGKLSDIYGRKKNSIDYNGNLRCRSLFSWLLFKHILYANS
jgi:MFS family permease